MGLTVKNLICHVRVTLPAETVETAGRPLDLSTLSKVEALIGDRFEDIRVHTDASAGELARGLGADAFITGRDVYFGHGRFEAVTGRGLGLIAHELVHRQQEREGSAGADAEREAMQAEREAAGAGRPQEAVYLDAGTPVAGEAAPPADEPKNATDIQRPKPSPADVEELLTAKVLELMRAELVTERERRGLLNGSGSRIPL